MREIKFKVRDKVLKTMITDDINISLLMDGRVKENYTLVQWYSIKESLIPLQYTWLKDKNWKEIYEGDIVRILYTDRLSKPANDIRILEQYLVDQSMIAVVVFNEDRFCLKVYSEKYEDYSYNSIFPWKHWFIEIIWNIYEDKHLLAN